MAGEDLYSALSGLQYSPYETPWGTAAATVGATAPNLINPYGSTGQAIGIALGGTLLSSLLGYQARQQAREQNLALLPALRSALTATTPESLETALAQPAAEKILPYAPQLFGRLLSAEGAKAGAEADLKKSLLVKGLELGYMPKGMEGLFEQQAQDGLTPKSAEKVAAETALFKAKKEIEQQYKEEPEKKDWFDAIPSTQKTKFTSAKGSAEELRTLADQFDALQMSGVNLQVQKRIPGSQADLAMSKMLSLVPSTARLLGEVGALSEGDQKRLIESTIGSSISGSESIAKRLRQLANTTNNTLKSQLQTFKTVAESGGDVLLKQLEEPQITDTTKTATDIENQINQLSVIVNDPQAPRELVAEALAKITELEAAL